MKLLQNISHTSPTDEKRTPDIYLPENPTGDMFFHIHGDHCQCIGQLDDRGRSILGQMVCHFIQSTKA